MLSFALKILWPALPFMDRVGLVFLACLGMAVVVLAAAAAPRNRASSRTEADRLFDQHRL